MRILITGASGFLGKYLVNHLREKHIEITAVGRDIDSLKRVFGSAVNVAQTDYSCESLTTLTANHDVVIHLASQLMERDTHPLKLSGFADNIRIMEHLLLACHESQVKKLIHTSSISAYNNQQLNAEENACIPANIYGVSKACCDIYASYFGSKTALQVTNLRLARLFGAGEREGLMMTDFINKANRGEALTIYGEGAASIEYVYVKDVVDAIEKTIKVDVAGVVNVGTGHLLSVKEIAETVNQVFHSDKPIVFLRDKPEQGVGSVMDVSKAEKTLDWQPKWTLSDALNDIKKIMGEAE